MKKTLLTMVLLFSWVVMPASAQAQETTKPIINYIGFNTLKSDNKQVHHAAFHRYVTAVLPIMAKYGMALKVFRVEHNSNPEMPVDFITFGTAPDQEKFQAFFQDKDFQAQFPNLVNAIGAHFVTFNDQTIMPSGQRADMQLALEWLSEKTPESEQKMAQINDTLVQLGRSMGATQTHLATGVLASVGLSNDVMPVEPPTSVSVWQMTDPHGFLESKEVQSLNKELSEILREYRTYWITEQHY